MEQPQWQQRAWRWWVLGLGVLVAGAARAGSRWTASRTRHTCSRLIDQSGDRACRGGAAGRPQRLPWGRSASP